MKSTNSFFSYTIGFLTFIGMSFALTYTVTLFEKAQSAEEQTAAAIQAMIGEQTRQ